jgi:repressor of nif and glnA expression
MQDLITKTALKIIQESNEVLETKEIEEKVSNSIKDITRTKLFSRLNNLRGEGLIKGKFVGPGKGVWIWWKKSLLE